MDIPIVLNQAAHLWLFFVMVFGVVLLPGLDMAYVLASSMVGGRRSGLTATAGIVAGGVCHVVMGALGIMAVLALWPAAFNLMLLAGAAYIAWIGISLLRSTTSFGHVDAGAVRSPSATFRHGAVTSLLNPKAYLFMLAIFPQFLKPEYGPVWLQALVLWLIIAVTQAGVYGSMALGADRVRGWMLGRPDVNALLGRTIGALLVATAIATGYGGWRSF